MNAKKNDDNNPDIKLKRKIKITIYFELFILLFLCCSNNSIIKEKKSEIIEKINISKENIIFYGLMLQFGRIVGIILIIIYFLSGKDCLQIQYIIALTTLCKSIAFLIYCLDLSKIYKWVVIASIIFQGFCHSFIDIYFPIWINHFINKNFKLLLLSISIGASPLSNILGFILNLICDSIKCCSLTLFILVFIFDLVFLMSVTKKCICYCDDISPNNYFNLLVSQNEDSNEINDEENKKLESKKNCNFLFSSENRCAFILIVLARAILKFSFVGIHYLINDYYDKLEGDEKLNEYIISYIPLFGLIIGAILSNFNWFRIKNWVIIIISLFIGILGTLTSILNNKYYFVVSLISFYGLTNLILPLLIQKSFDCFEDRQLWEISYVFNCFIYLLIGNFLSSLFNYFLEDKFLMKFYLNVVWINFIFTLCYKINIGRKDSLQKIIEEVKKTKGQLLEKADID